MYTAKITNKEERNGQFIITVEFTDGVDTVTETVVPQDRQGFEHWVKQRAQSLTTAKELREEDNIGQEVDIAEEVPTQAELDQQEWLKTYYRLEQLEKMADKGFLTGARLTALNNKISQAKAFLDANAKVEYLDII